MRSMMCGLALAAGLGVAISATGCLATSGVLAGVATGAAVYIYVTGTLTADFPKPIDDVYRATLAAVTKLQLSVVDHSKDNLSAHILATEAQGGDIRITLVSKEPNVTQVNIRVGILGDGEKSRKIMKTIEDNL